MLIAPLEFSCLMLGHVAVAVIPRVCFVSNTAPDFGPRHVDIQELLDSVVVHLCQQIDVSLAALRGRVAQTRRHLCSSETGEVEVAPKVAFTFLVCWF